MYCSGSWACASKKCLLRKWYRRTASVRAVTSPSSPPCSAAARAARRSSGKAAAAAAATTAAAVRPCDGLLRRFGTQMVRTRWALQWFSRHRRPEIRSLG